MPTTPNSQNQSPQKVLFKDRPYPSPDLPRDEPDLYALACAYDILGDELAREYNQSKGVSERMHADHMIGLLMQLRVMMRGRIEKEKDEYLRQLYL